jgi:hypothetical protein
MKRKLAPKKQKARQENRRASDAIVYGRQCSISEKIVKNVF